MEIKNHRLLGESGGQPIEFRESANQSSGIEPTWLVMHYTAGASFESSVDWLTQRRRPGSSAHLVIGRSGEVAQLVAFNKRAWHAGISHWQGKSSLNRYSIGIELDNAGVLHTVGGQWRTEWERHIPEDEVVEAVHKHEHATRGWHAYTEKQLAAALAVSLLLVQKYGLRDIIGHDDISPGRKSDPGPAFPMRAFRSALYGRGDVDTSTYTAVALNIRSGPGTENPQLEGGVSPLPPGTAVTVLDADGAWRLVQVDREDGAPYEGWVHGRYLHE